MYIIAYNIVYYIYNYIYMIRYIYKLLLYTYNHIQLVIQNKGLDYLDWVELSISGGQGVLNEHDNPHSMLGRFG